jgi:hypothetical protein
MEARVARGGTARGPLLHKVNSGGHAFRLGFPVRDNGESSSLSVDIQVVEVVILK